MPVFPDSSLKSQLHPLITRLADRILELWHTIFELDPYTLPEDLGYIEGRLEGEKLIIENSCFQTRPFRKMHLELAQAGAGIEILHCVMFPRLTYALPLFGCDIVAARGHVSAAIVDLSPVSGESLSTYSARLDPWVPIHQTFQERRELPAWGAIFSPYCLFIRPQNQSEADQFLDVASAYLEIHCQLALQATPDADPQLVYQGQHHYCTQQQQNDRTRRILEKAFGAEWAERYMTTVLFDLPTIMTASD